MLLHAPMWSPLFRSLDLPHIFFNKLDIIQKHIDSKYKCPMIVSNFMVILLCTELRISRKLKIRVWKFKSSRTLYGSQGQAVQFIVKISYMHG